VAKAPSTEKSSRIYPPPSLGKAPLAPRRSAAEAAGEKVLQEIGVEKPAPIVNAEPPESAAAESVEKPAKTVVERPADENVAQEPERDGNGASEPAGDADAAARLAFKLRRKTQRQEQPPATT
jgi:hypothetical protein